MNLVHMALIYLIGKNVRGKNGQPLWPDRNHPPPKRAHKRVHTHHDKAPDKPAAGPQADMKVGPVTTIKHGRPVKRRRVNYGAPPSLAHTEKAQHSPANSDHAAHYGAPPAWDVHTGDAQIQKPEELHADAPAPEPAASHVEDHQDEGVYTVARIQALLRGLGWTGRNSMQGPVQAPLKDGLYGPVTAENWQRSANKRGLDPSIVRIDGTHVHVAPETFKALIGVARSKGANVSGRRPMYIP